MQYNKKTHLMSVGLESSSLEDTLFAHVIVGVVFSLFIFSYLFDVNRWGRYYYYYIVQEFTYS